MELINAVGNVAVHLQGGVAVQIGVVGEPELLELQLRILQLLHRFQRVLAGVGLGHGLAGVDFFALLHLPQQGAGHLGQRRFLPDDPAVHGDGIGHLPRVSHRHGHRLVKVPVRLNAQKRRHGQKHRDG